MPYRQDPLIRWVPRIAGFLFMLFLAVFALDVFGESLPIGRMAIALGMHLIPAALVLLTVALAWRREWIGTVAYPLLSIVHVLMSWGRFDWTTYVVIDGPLVLLAVLCWVAWLSRVRPARVTG